MAEASLLTEHDPRMDYEPPSVARGGAEALLFRVAEAVLQAALLILTARLMEPAGRGLYALASLTAMLCSLPLGPVWSAGAIEVARRRTPLPELFGGLSVIAAVGGALTAVGGFAVAALLGDRWWVVAFPAAAAPFILFARYGEGLYQAVGHVRAVNWITIGRVLLPLAFITPPLIAGADARSAIEIWTLWLVALPVLIYFPLRRVVGGRRLPAEHGLYRRLVVTGGTLSVANFALIMGPRIALIALAIFADDAAVGVFSVAVAAGDLLYLTTNSLVSSGFRGIASRPRAESIDLATRSIRHALVLALAVGMVLVPAVRVLLPDRGRRRIRAGSGLARHPASRHPRAVGLLGAAHVLHRSGREAAARLQDRGRRDGRERAAVRGARARSRVMGRRAGHDGREPAAGGAVVPLVPPDRRRAVCASCGPAGRSCATTDAPANRPGALVGVEQPRRDRHRAEAAARRLEHALSCGQIAGGRDRASEGARIACRHQRSELRPDRLAVRVDIEGDDRDAAREALEHAVAPLLPKVGATSTSARVRQALEQGFAAHAADHLDLDARTLHGVE